MPRSLVLTSWTKFGICGTLVALFVRRADLIRSIPATRRASSIPKQYGDTLVVVVNGDDFLTRKKGKPFMDLTTRCRIVSCIRGVDFVIPFEIENDSTVCEALRRVRPHVLHQRRRSHRLLKHPRMAGLPGTGHQDHSAGRSPQGLQQLRVPGELGRVLAAEPNVARDQRD